jgi:hypothetical protein
MTRPRTPAGVELYKSLHEEKAYAGDILYKDKPLKEYSEEDLIKILLETQSAWFRATVLDHWQYRMGVFDLSKEESQ